MIIEQKKPILTTIVIILFLAIFVNLTIAQETESTEEPSSTEDHMTEVPVTTPTIVPTNTPTATSLPTETPVPEETLEVEVTTSITPFIATEASIEDDSNTATETVTMILSQETVATIETLPIQTQDDTNIITETSVPITSTATLPTIAESTIEATIQGTPTTPPTETTITPTATLGGIAMTFTQGQIFIQGRDEQVGIEVQILDESLTLLSVAKPEVGGRYNIAIPTNDFFWLVADAPLAESITLPLQPGDGLPNLTLAGGDIDDDGCIGSLDLALLQQSSQTDHLFDLTGDQFINISDYAVLTSNYDETCLPLPTPTPTMQPTETIATATATTIIEVATSPTTDVSSTTITTIIPTFTMAAVDEPITVTTTSQAIIIETTEEFIPEITVEVTADILPEATSTVEPIETQITLQPPTTTATLTLQPTNTDVPTETATLQPTATPTLVNQVEPSIDSTDDLPAIIQDE